MNQGLKIVMGAAGGLSAALVLFSSVTRAAEMFGIAEVKVPAAEVAVQDMSAREALHLKLFLHRAGVQAGSATRTPPVTDCTSFRDFRFRRSA